MYTTTGMACLLASNSRTGPTEKPETVPENILVHNGSLNSLLSVSAESFECNN